VIIVLAAAAVVALIALTLTVGRSGPRDATAVPHGSAGPQQPQHSTTLAPDPSSDTQAAVRGHWPLKISDEFNGTTLDSSTWSPYDGYTTQKVGRNKPENISVGNGVLTINSHGNESGGLSWYPGQLYGRWEVRARSQAGAGYGPVMLLWPDAEDWPEGGEIDFLEMPKPERRVANFTVHYGPDNSQDGVGVPGDFTQWHNYAVEWEPDHITGYIDGQEIFHTTAKDEIPPRPMHLAIQQDVGPYGDDWIPARNAQTPSSVGFQVDWVRIYGP
jgi:beta-glucanase (GH16 family)